MGGGPIFPLEEAFYDEQMVRHEERDANTESRETCKESEGNELKDEDGKKKKRKDEKKNDTEGTPDAEKLKKKLLKLDHKLEKIILKKKDCLKKLTVIERSDERKDEASFASRVKECTCKAEESEATKSKQKKERRKEDKKEGKSSVEKLSKRLAGLYGRLGYLLSETQDCLQEIQHGDVEVPLRTHHKPKDRKVERLF